MCVPKPCPHGNGEEFGNKLSALSLMRIPVIPLDPPLKKGEIPRSPFFKGGLGGIRGEHGHTLLFLQGDNFLSHGIFLA
ncbi:MAG: hypothetical protein JETT_0777 [Candidatus Jettenia ecosi]|uniref:Uncharacterized protein n=1 Tax=Candidatus Jettenia ecosi TaxID=2494326 RepID=A0A533QDP8_9BACT|nr:MAG: hypothetical protein JETT_0777 [Candidatus Jettenia ecosi]